MLLVINLVWLITIICAEKETSLSQVKENDIIALETDLSNVDLVAAEGRHGYQKGHGHYGKHGHHGHKGNHGHNSHGNKKSLQKFSVNFVTNFRKIRWWLPSRWKQL